MPFPIPAQIQPPPQAHSERSSPSKCPISAPPERAPAEDRKVDGHQPTVGPAVRKMRKGYRRGDSIRALRHDDQRPSVQNRSLIVYLGSPYTIGTCARLPGPVCLQLAYPPTVKPPSTCAILPIRWPYPPTTTMKGPKNGESKKESPPQKIDPTWYVLSTTLPTPLATE